MSDILFGNNNHAVARKLSKRSFFANKSRNIFVLTAIVLTTILITAVLTITISLFDGIQQMMIHANGRSTQVDFQCLTESEAERITAHPLIKEYGQSRLIAQSTEGIFQQMPCEIYTADKNFAGFTFSAPTTGRMPEAENEIALTSWILDAMGLPRELGQAIHLDFEVGDKSHSMDFIVCGFWDSDINLQPYGRIYLSEPLADRLLADIDATQMRMTGNYVGSTKITANINGSLSKLGVNVDTILNDTGIDAKTVGTLLNGAYSTGTMDTGMVAAMVLIILIILASGYLLIYNIFYISVMRDVKFYGLLKTIGTTQKQIGRIVNLQSLILCAIGIPVGLLLGYLLGIVLIPVLLSTIAVDYMAAPLNPWIFLLGAVLALVTVRISCQGPAKKASKVSPIEAVRYTTVSLTSAKKTKQGIRGARISRMAWSNLFRSRKKAVLVIASLSVGLILFNIVYTYVGSYDVNKFLQTHINGDFLIADANYFNIAKPYTKSHTLSEGLLSEMETLDGVQKVAKVYYETAFTPIDGTILENMKQSQRRGILLEDPSLNEQQIEEIIERTDFITPHDGHINAQVYGFDNYWFDKLEENMIEGTFDREKFLSGDYVLLGYGEDLVQVGDTVTLKMGDKDGEQRSYEVMGRINYNALQSLSAHSMLSPGFSVYLPSTEFDSITAPDIMSATVIADETAVNHLQTEIGALLSGNTALDYRSRADYISEMTSDNRQTALIGLTLCAVILLIGILNFINTTMTNIFSRKQELAMMQSVGMTAKQSKQMLILEGVYYMALMLLIFISIGYSLSYIIVNALVRNSAAYTYQFSFIPLFISFPVLMLLAFVLPICVYNRIAKDSVVERLRTTE